MPLQLMLTTICKMMAANVIHSHNNLLNNEMNIFTYFEQPYYVWLLGTYISVVVDNVTKMPNCTL